MGFRDLSWRRGLKRLYILLWLLWGAGFAVATVTFALEEWNLVPYNIASVALANGQIVVATRDGTTRAIEDWELQLVRASPRFTKGYWESAEDYSRRAYQSSSSKFIEEDGRGGWRDMSDEEVNRIRWYVYHDDQGVLRVVDPRRPSELTADELSTARSTLRAPGLMLKYGTAFAIPGIILPYLFLVTVRWIVSGFTPDLPNPQQ
jgi:hypothetical protein